MWVYFWLNYHRTASFLYTAQIHTMLPFSQQGIYSRQNIIYAWTVCSESEALTQSMKLTVITVTSAKAATGKQWTCMRLNGTGATKKMLWQRECVIIIIVVVVVVIIIVLVVIQTLLHCFEMVCCAWANGLRFPSVVALKIIRALSLLIWKERTRPICFCNDSQVFKEISHDVIVYFRFNSMFYRKHPSLIHHN